MREFNARRVNPYGYEPMEQWPAFHINMVVFCMRQNLFYIALFNGYQAVKSGIRPRDAPCVTGKVKLSHAIFNERLPRGIRPIVQVSGWRVANGAMALALC